MTIVNDPSQGNVSDDAWDKGIDLDALNKKYLGSTDDTPSAKKDDWAAGIDLNSLNKKYLGVDSSKASADNSGAYRGSNLGPLQPKSSAPDDLSPADKPSSSGFSWANPDIVYGAVQGLKDIPNTGAQLIGWVDSKLSDAGAKRNEDFTNRLNAEKAALPVGNSVYDAGRIGGQVLATAPLMPAAAMGAVGNAARAVPYVGRLLAPAATGAMGGAAFGAATNSANDEGLLSNVGHGAGYGAVAGPLVDAGAGAANSVVNVGKSIVNSARIANAVKGSGIEPSAAKNMLAVLEEQGLTPAQAQAKLATLGPNATLADLTPGLTDEASGLAAMTGKQSNQLKTRYQDRASTADDAAHTIMETKLGPKPDLEVEKQAVHDAATKAVSTDYAIAHKSNQALDVQPIVDSIDSELKNAVGETKTTLAKAKSYFYDDAGNIKADVAPLHSVRKEIDANLKTLEKSGESQSPAYRSLTDIRSQLDAKLKTNPEMAAADAKFAEHMNTKGGLDIGYKAIGPKPNYDKFEREFTNASPEKQDTIRKGLRAQIGDMMEAASRGELAGAQQLFAKKAANRKIMQLAFGNNGDEVLNALEKQAALRATERGVSSGSQTASRQAVRERYGAPAEEVRLRDIAMAGATDIALGSPGVMTAATTAKRGVSHLMGRIGDASREAQKVGTADLLSRNASQGRDSGLDILNTVKKIQSGKKFALPVDSRRLLSNTAIPSVKEGKKSLGKIRGISEQD